MKEILPFRLQSKNTYLFANKLDFKYVMLSHPLLATYLLDNDTRTDAKNEEDVYYRQKAEYLQSKLPKNNHLYSGRIQPEQIEEAFLNLNQIVFEVTDSCNLNCSYCGYGDLYGNYDRRENKSLNIEEVAPLFSFLDNLQQRKRNKSIDNSIYISFYGGEPLMNMDFVKEMVSFTRSRKQDEHKYVFSMTTNAILLHQYMDYLAEHSFRLLISLDGNEESNSYRKTKSGKSSFDTITKNIDLLQSKHPEYFKESVNFNAVLHNNNSVEEIYNYIQTHYGKTPRIAELNHSGILPEKKEEFDRMYRNREESLYQSEQYTKLEQKLFTFAPSYYNATNFLHTYNLGVVKTYNDFFDNNKQQRFIPTGTCMPFSKKIFITVNGKLLPCERIGHQYALGQISKTGVEIDFENIASKFNTYYDKLARQCSKCYQLGACFQCIFTIDTIDDEKPVCSGFMDKNTFADFLAANVSFFESRPLDYYRIMEEVVLK